MPPADRDDDLRDLVDELEATLTDLRGELRRNEGGDDGRSEPTRDRGGRQYGSARRSAPERPRPPSLSELLEATVNEFLAGLTAGIPRVMTGVVFLVLAALVIRAAVAVVRVVLGRVYPGQPIYVQLGATLVGVFLWFGAILGFLSAVGLPEIAAALGTASGFLALGVSYALSGMLADAVAGIYLLRDPDFNPGDTVVAGDVEGVVKSIELRKTRFRHGEDTVVRANADVEKKWTKKPE